MLTNMNVLIVGTDKRLQTLVESRGPETIITSSFSRAIDALKTFSLDCAVLVDATIPFDFDAFSKMLQDLNMPLLLVCNRETGDDITTQIDNLIGIWLEDLGKADVSQPRENCSGQSLMPDTEKRLSICG